MASASRLNSVLQHLARSHRDDAGFRERVDVLAASLFLTAPELPIKRLTADLLHFCKLQLYDKETDDSLLLECAAAAIFLCKERSQGLGYTEDLIEYVFLPLLTSASVFLAPKQPEVARALFEVLASQQAWLQVHLLLNKCATALIPASRDLPAALHTPLTGLTVPADPGFIQESDGSWLRDVNELPLHAVLLLVQEGLPCFFRGGQGSREARACADSNTRQLLLCSLACLFSEEEHYRQAALKGLLPAAMASAQALEAGLEEAALGSIWTCARFLVADSSSRSTGLALLVQFQPMIQDSLRPQANGHANGHPSGETAATHQQHPLMSLADATFCQLLKECMVDGEPLNRKRALFLLQKALPAEEEDNPSWSLFFLLYNILEEVACYLILDAWQEHMGNLLLCAEPNFGQLSGDGSGLRFELSWLTVLWRRGLAHSNPQVQRLVAENLLELPWSEAQLLELPPAFITGCLFPIVTDPQVAKVKQEHLTTLLGGFLVMYLRAVTPDRKWQMLSASLSEISAKNVQRSSLQLMVAALAAAAKGSGPLCSFSEPAELDQRAALLISRLKGATGNLESFHGSAFAVSISKGLLQLASRLLPSATVQLGTVAPLLECFPLGSFKPGGALHSRVQDWLEGAAENRSWLPKAISELFTEYFCPRQGSMASAAVDAVEFANWEAEAQRFARLLLFVSKNCESLETLFLQLENRIQELYHRPYLAKGSGERSLLMLGSIFQVIEPELVSLAAEKRSSNTTWLQLRMTKLVSNIYDELGLFAKSAWQSFWSPLHTSSLPPPQHESSGLEAPQQFGLKTSKLSAGTSAALQRAALALNCVAQGSLCFARFRPMLESSPLGGAAAESRRASSDTACDAAVSPVLAASSYSPQHSSWLERRKSSSPDYDSPLAGRRRSNHEASTLGLLKNISEAAVQFVQCFASTPLPMPKSPAGAVVAQAYAEVRGQALSSLAKTLEALSAAAYLDRNFAAWLVREINLGHLQQSILQIQVGKSLTGMETARWKALDCMLTIAEHAEQGLTAKQQTAMVLAALEAIDSAHELTLPSLLRCLRYLLRCMICKPGVAAAAAAALQQHLPSDLKATDPLVGIYWAALKSCWAALQDVQSRTVTFMAAFLQTALLPEAFDCAAEDDARWRLHAEGGPLRWLVENLLVASSKNVRLSVLVSLHLTKLLTDNPVHVPRYVGCYKQLLLQGNPPSDTTGRTTLEVEGLGASTNALDVSNTLESITASGFPEYGETDLAGRVAAVCGVQRLAAMATAPGDGAKAAQAAEAGRCLWVEVFATACAPPVRISRSKISHPHSLKGRQKLRLWQAACTLVTFAPPENAQEIATCIFEKLEDEPLVPVKACKEAMLTHLFLKRPDLTQSYLLLRLLNYSQKVDSLPSAILVAARLVVHSSADGREQLLVPIITALIPWALTHHQSVRAYTQVILQALLHQFPDQVKLAEHPQLAAVASFLETNPGMRKLAKTREWALQDLAPETAMNPSNVFAKDWAKKHDGDELLLREGAPTVLLDKISEFLSAERASIRAAPRRGGTEALEALAPNREAEGQSALDVQRKQQPVNHVMSTSSQEDWWDALLHALPADITTELQATQRNAKRQKIVVVASLLEKVPNLAGLSRTCEVFAAEALVLSDKRLVKDREFTAISVTAEQHIPLKEVAAEDLGPWLVQQRQSGYTILGLEQTAEAVPLPGYNFPEKVVLLLGREKEGIPPDLLRLLDQALVIPQLGVIRSLNAHVSGSIALFEYTRRHMNLPSPT